MCRKKDNKKLCPSSLDQRNLSPINQISTVDLSNITPCLKIMWMSAGKAIFLQDDWVLECSNP